MIWTLYIIYLPLLNFGVIMCQVFFLYIFFYLMRHLKKILSIHMYHASIYLVTKNNNHSYTRDQLSVYCMKNIVTVNFFLCDISSGGEFVTVNYFLTWYITNRFFWLSLWSESLDWENRDFWSPDSRLNGASAKQCISVRCALLNFLFVTELLL